MIQIRCYAANVRTNMAAPQPPYLLGQNSISDYFEEGSLGDITLVVDTTRLDITKIPNAYLTTDEGLLSWALDKVLPRTEPNEIGLLFADTYRGRGDVFGLMFDLGFNPPYGPSLTTDYTREPREGCAVFCKAIADARGHDQQEAEMVFTAIHELGHVFNLWHLDEPADPPTFMFSSANLDHLLEPPYGFGTGDGRLAQQEFLSHCSVWDCVRPRGTSFGARRMGPEEDLQHYPANRARLRLKLEVAQQEVWWFEPLELDMKLEVPSNVQRSYRVPDRVDPGYEDFQIWVETPNGERRRYRSPRHYCGRKRFLEIDSNCPFMRDVSIFGQAGGYTFSAPGVYSILAWFLLNERHALRSNSVEVEVKQPQVRSPQYRRLARVLTPPRHARLLYHRGSMRMGSHVRSLEDFCRASEEVDASANVSYALGRALDSAARRLSARERRRDYERRALEHLRRALEFQKLSSNRRRRGEEAVDRLRTTER